MAEHGMFYEDLFRKLKSDGVRFVVVGGVALVLHGVVRLTVDIDLMVEMSNGNLTKFIAAVQALGYQPKPPVMAEEFIDPAKRKSWKEEKGMLVFSFFHPEEQGKLIDVFVDEPIPFDEIERDRKVIKAEDIEIPIVSIDHLKRLKRISGRPQDLADIEALEEME